MEVKLIKAILLFCTLILLIPLGIIEETEQEVTFINMSEEALAIRDEKEASRVILSEEEQIDSLYDKTLPNLKKRTEQVFPTIETESEVEKVSYKLGDTYTLSNDIEYDCIILYLHGGSWIGEMDTRHVRLCDKLATDLYAKVVMAMYPLAPEATYKETFAMINEVYTELLKEGKPIYIMGDSAGASITLGFTLDLVARGVTPPEKVVVIAPVADGSLSNDEIDEIEAKDLVLYRHRLRESLKLWANGEDLTMYAFSPIYGNYKNFPDTLIIIGNCDLLYPDDMLLYKKMRQDGANAELVVGNGLWHIFPTYLMPEQDTCIRIINNFVHDW